MSGLSAGETYTFSASAKSKEQEGEATDLTQTTSKHLS